MPKSPSKPPEHRAEYESARCFRGFNPAMIPKAGIMVKPAGRGVVQMVDAVAHGAGMVFNRYMSLYHYEIGLPARYRHPMAVVSVEWSQHAMREARKDRYGDIPVTNSLDLKGFSTIEVETDERGVIVKILVRGRLDERRDVCYAIMPKAGAPWFIKTVWINVNRDKHRTLNRDRYDTP